MVLFFTHTGVKSDNANQFADHIYNYEKRIIETTTEAFKSSNETYVIKTLGTVQSFATSVSILNFFFYLLSYCLFF